jgi:arsenate reductase
MRVYGIPNCDTVKKSLTWLKTNGIDVEFHDFKKLGISDEKLKEWSAQVGWEALINKKGQTWKKLDPAVQQSITTEQAAFELMKEKTSVIKRPVVETGKGIIQGFSPELYQQQLEK